MRNRQQLSLVVVLICCSLCAFDADAKTISAASCSLSDVTAAYNAASNGDTVSIPAGTCTWDVALTVTKLITIAGAGGESTKIITRTSTYHDPAIRLQPASDGAQRITGIYFYDTSPAHYAVEVYGKITSLRIDHNKFEQMYMTITSRGWVYGVIDSNTFLNCDSGVQALGDGNDSWTRWVTEMAGPGGGAGQANALFIENNAFITDSNVAHEPNEQVTHGQGPRTVIRYNNFDAHLYSAGNGLPIEAHGSANYYTGTDIDLRGMPIMEIYNNAMHVNHTYRFVFIRGGSSLVYNNTMVSDNGAGVAIQLTEEEGWACPPTNGVFSSCRTTWPAEDQVNNTFIWNNTLNGSAVTDISKLPSDAIFIQKDRDYFMHAPQPTGGYERWTGRAGASNTAPTTGSSSTMQFSSSGANAYYPYTPYAYPHPLAGGVGLTAPSNLRVSSTPQ